jgi:hypothetical protein
VEVEHSALHGGAEAEERRHAEVGPGETALVLVLRMKCVMSAAGRPHSAIAFAAAAAVSSGTALSVILSRAPRDGTARSRKPGWLPIISSVWCRWRFLIPEFSPARELKPGFFANPGNCVLWQNSRTYFKF